MLLFRTRCAWCAAAIVAVLLAVAAVGARADDSTVTGLAAVNRVIGNTLLAHISEGDIIFFFAADHTVKTKAGNKVGSGPWRVRDDKLCFGPEQTCASVEVKGTHVKMTPEDSDDILEGELVQGNAYKL